jgi:signal transduction histidine kinase
VAAAGRGRKEEFIGQNPDSRVDGRAKTPTLSQAVRRYGRATVVVSTLVLVALTWIGARDAIDAHRAEVHGRAQAELMARTLTFEEQLRRELLSLDQTLRILEYEWERDPEHFDLAARADQVVVLSGVSLQLFVADAHGIVRSSTRPAILGTDITGRDYFRHEAELPADDGRMFLGELTLGQVTRLWQFNMARRLENRDGSFGGVMVASYDANALARFYRDVDRGMHGEIAVVSMRDGNAWSLASQDSAPIVTGIGNRPLFARMRRTDEGEWAGASGLDEVDRLYAFAAVPGYDLRAVVGTERATAMRAADVWARTALIFAGGVTLLLLLLALILLRTLETARRRNEELARERTILEAALAGMSDGIMMVDAELQLLAWNQHFPEFTGVPANILHAGLPMEDILRAQVAAGEFGPVDLETEVARRMGLLRAGATMGTVERPRPDGRQLEIRRNPLSVGGFVTLYTDVTARRQAEERLHQAQTLAAIGRLTAGVAHDFNNLLSAISGNAEILHEQLERQPELASRLAVILRSSARGADLVRRLLAFARKQSLVPVLVNLNNVVGGMGDLLRATLGRSVRVETKLDDALWPALIDPVQIEHVILNLAINARDAMPNGGTLTIATANTTVGRHGASADLPEGDYAVVAVSDTGTGMSEEVQRNAFEPFFTTKPPGEGSGLGLSQVYGVATQSGGGVRIESALGRGTTVSVFFPRAMPAPDADTLAELQSVPATDPPAENANWNRRVLVVDDEADCRDTISAMLVASGFNAYTAESGEAALRLVDSGTDFHVLLVDFEMPGINGLELAQAVRARRPSIPVVFFTGGDGATISGERWVLTKPFVSRTLINTLRAALGLSPERQTQTV